MRNYDSGVSRSAVGVAAAAMTVFTLGMLVILPASIENGSESPDLLAAANGAAQHCVGATPKLRAAQSREANEQACLHAPELLTTN